MTHEVLPSIRKHGAYMTQQTLDKALTSPDFLIQLATKLKEEQEKVKRNWSRKPRRWMTSRTFPMLCLSVTQRNS